MMIQHNDLFAGRWAEMSLAEQMANIGSEVSRTASWMEKGNSAHSRKSFERGLELIDLSISASPRPSATVELCRLREYFCFLFTEKKAAELRGFVGYFTPFAIEFRRSSTSGEPR